MDGFYEPMQHRAESALPIRPCAHPWSKVLHAMLPQAWCSVPSPLLIRLLHAARFASVTVLGLDRGPLSYR
jgi:hypothetical protein